MKVEVQLESVIFSSNRSFLEIETRIGGGGGVGRELREGLETGDV